MIDLYNGDCLIKNKHIEDGSVDLILMDPPYGTMKGINTEGYGRKEHDNHNWDTAIAPIDIFNIANRILRKNGKLIMFSQEPYTSKLINEAIPNIPFSYRAIWKKDHFANSLSSKKTMVNYFEDILIFSKNNPKHVKGSNHPLSEYFRDCKKQSKMTNKSFNNLFSDFYNKKGNRDRSVMEHYWNIEQFVIPTEEIYNEILAPTGFFNKPYEELKEIDNQFKKQHLEEETKKNPSIFNLWEGKKYKSNILEYKKDYTGQHPAQKPVLLLEDLIKTYSNEGNLIVDLTMGSGTTGVACKNTNRKFIGIELDEGYFNIAKDRIGDM